MKKAIVAAAVACAACSPQDQQPVENRQTAEPAPAAPAAQLAPLQPPAPGTPGGLPDDRTPLEEPKGAIDQKSAEAAGQVVQSYGALIEQGRFTEAERLWRDAERADGVSEELRRYSEVHLQVGKPEEPEGAAGSIFVNVPTVLYGKRKDGSAFSRSGQMTLRRVNDVPGSTAAERRWHIESAAWTEMR